MSNCNWLHIFLDQDTVRLFANFSTFWSSRDRSHDFVLSRDRNLVFIYDQWKSISFKCVKYQSVFLVLSNVKININANPPLLLSSPINRTFTGQLNFFSKHMSFSRTIHRTFIFSPDGYTVKFHQLPIGHGTLLYWLNSRTYG